MARTNKTINSNRSDDHMGRRRQLRIDSRDQLERHINEKVRKSKNLPPLSLDDPALEPESPDDEGPRSIEEENDLELARGAEMILALRAYGLNSSGALIGYPVDEDEFCAAHRQVRREREFYRELNGQRVQVGEELERHDTNESRKEKIRKVPGVLKSIMIRLMRHEGVAFAAAKDDGTALAAAIDETVKAFELETGCEAVTAVVHRMSPTDCHIHIQYTMVQAVTESKHMLGRRLKPWKELASKLARESLAAEDILDPAPAAVGARKRQLIASGKLAPQPERGIEFRKFPGIRDMGDGAILGYSFRQKLNLVRAAEAGGEKQLGEQVTQRNDERFGRFAPIAARNDADLNAKYLDLWLEREWRRNVTSRFPEEIQERLVSDGVSAARNYAVFGTTAVEEEHIRRRAKELEAKEKELLREREALKGDALKAQAQEEQTKLVIAKAQKSANEANERVEALRIEADELRDKAGLFDQVVSLLAQILDLPNVGLIVRTKTALWKCLENIAPKIGLVNKLAAIAKVRSSKTNKPDPNQDKPGNLGN